MQVYILTAYWSNDDDNNYEVMGVFDKPRAARRWLDKRIDFDTKNRWKKGSRGTRRFLYEGVVYYINEYKLVKDKLDNQ